MPLQYQITGSTSVGIAESLEQGIVSGSLAPSELLPPIRDLASELGVSAGTVATAYRLARQRGLTISDRRRGTRVRAWKRETTPAPASARRRSEAPPDVTDLASGSPDQALLPDLAAVVRTLDYRPGNYGALMIEPGLAEVARKQLSKDRIPAEVLTCTFGALDAISRVLTASLRSGDRVGIEDPGWPALIDGITQWGLVPVPISVDDEGPIPDSLWEALAAGARAIVVTSRAQNPTGAAVTAERAATLVDVLSRYPGVLTIEDDHGHGITSTAVHPLVGAAAAGNHGLPGPWAFVRSAGKAYGPDLRLAVVAGDPTTVARVETSLSAGAGWVSHLLQQAVARMWSDRDVGALVRNSASTYDSRRDALLDELDRLGVAATGRSGLNVWIPTSDEAASVARLLAAGWLVGAGRAWRLASDPGIRVTTASLATELAPGLAKAVAEAIGGAPGGGY